MFYIKFNHLTEVMIVCKMLLLLIAFVFIKMFMAHVCFILNDDQLTYMFAI